MHITAVATLDLQAGDRIRLGFGLGDVTVAYVRETGWVASRNRPIYAVMYAELDANGDPRGNSGTADTTWQVIGNLAAGIACYACGSPAVAWIDASTPRSEPFAYGMVSSRPACAIHNA